MSVFLQLRSYIIHIIQSLALGFIVLQNVDAITLLQYVHMLMQNRQTNPGITVISLSG